ncbi:MAG: DNA alkylation repair protein [Clostridia bacterium]|nr:DNA alkylation repair protein [Clostridia bacterium]
MFSNAKWTNDDFEKLDNYLKKLSKGEEKSNWEKRIVNTNMPCIAVPSCEIDKLSRSIIKSDYLQFLNNFKPATHSHILLIGKVLSRIKDVDCYLMFLEKYLRLCDNWSSTDVLKYPINKNNEEVFYSKAKELLNRKEPFARRVGLLILMKGFLNDEYIDKVLLLANSMSEEQHYYVNMMNAWLIAEAFTKQREKTLEFLEKHTLNNFTINKAISKCRDSYRVSKEDKQMLLKYKVK